MPGGDGRPKLAEELSQIARPSAADDSLCRLLASLYRPQQTNSSCSNATLALVLSAMRTQDQLPPVSEDQVVASDPTGGWARAASADGDGVSLPELGLLARQALLQLGGPTFRGGTVSIAHLPHAGLPGALASQAMRAFQAVLGETRHSPPRSFVVLNALQSLLFSGGVPVGHFVVVGAFDGIAMRVLLFDVGNNAAAFGPFWVPFNALWSAMQTRDDATGETRGYLCLRAGE